MLRDIQTKLLAVTLEVSSLPSLKQTHAMTARPPNAVDELRKHYAAVRARIWATKPQQARVAKCTSDIPSVPEQMPRPEPPEGTVDEVAEIWRQHDRLLGDAHLSIDAVIHVTAAYFHITVAELLSARRVGHLVRPRQVAVYLARALLCETKSTCQIGHHFHRDHATVIRACRQVAARVAIDEFFAEMVSTLRVYLARAEAPPEISDAIEAECEEMLGNIATLRARIAGIEESHRASATQPPNHCLAGTEGQDYARQAQQV